MQAPVVHLLQRIQPSLSILLALLPLQTGARGRRTKVVCRDGGSFWRTRIADRNSLTS